MGARSAALGDLGDPFAWSLLDAVPDATLILSADGDIAFASDRAAELFDCDLDDLVGRPIEDLVPHDVRQVHRAHRTRYQADPTGRPMGVGLDLRARRPDGTEFPVEISLSPLVVDGASMTVASIRDTTARVEAEEHLHRVMQTLDASPDALFIFDAQTLRYSFVNDGAVRMMGYSRDELLVMTPLHLNPCASRSTYEELVSDLEAEPDRPVQHRSTLLRKDGSEVPVEKTFQLGRVGSDGTRWLIVLARDISRRLQNEAELEASRDALNAAEQAAAIADDRERIARDMHDTVIQRLFAEGLHLQAVSSNVDPETGRKLQPSIDGLDEAIRQLRTSIFTLTRPSVDDSALRAEIFDVVDAVTETSELETRLVLEGPVETVDSGVRDHLIPVLRETLTNVVRHAGADSVDITLAVDETVRLEVSDDGVGVSEDRPGGNGLHNLRSRAEELGGTCTVTSSPDGGTTVAWEVPAPA